MDKDQIIHELDRTLRIRALFAFETGASALDEEQCFLEEAVHLVRSQPGLAACIDAPDALMRGAIGGDC